MRFEDDEPVEPRGERLLAEWTRLPVLQEDEVQVFALSTASEPDLAQRAAGRVTEPERERAARVRVLPAREEFVVGRAALRVLLGAALNCEPRRVALQADSAGKPFVPGIHCNVSHSRGLIYVALCRAAAVGVDVEWVDPGLEALEIAQANFRPEEIATIAAEPAGSARARAFCRIWTLKEAVAKAYGEGLRVSLSDILVPSDRPGWAAIAAKEGNEGRKAELAVTPATFAVGELPAPAEFVAAIAVYGSALRINFFPLSYALQYAPGVIVGLSLERLGR